MKMLPIDFDFDFASDAKRVFDLIKSRTPLPVWEEIYTNEHLLIDDIVTNYFGFPNRQEDIRYALVEQVNFRLVQSATTRIIAAIDLLAYELYGLTTTEVAAVEGQ